MFARSRLLSFCVVVFVCSACQAQLAAPSLDYRAYWLTDNDPETAKKYSPLLLLTRLPITKLQSFTESMEEMTRMENAVKANNPKYVEQQLRPSLLESMALVIETYNKDSIWNMDGRPIKTMGVFTFDKKNLSVNYDGREYRLEAASLTDVVKLLKKPEGTQGLHRLFAPLAGAQQTGHALRCMLQVQIEEANFRGLSHLLPVLNNNKLPRQIKKQLDGCKIKTSTEAQKVAVYSVRSMKC